MKRILSFFFLLPLTILSYSQDTLRITPVQVETLFLQNNLQLVAQRFEIDMAQAAVVQARLWENPTITVGDLNLWSTRSQRDGETIPALLGGFGHNTEFSIELTQLIRTAGKRRKLVKREQVAGDIAVQEFEELLRNLRVELRERVAQTIYLQEYLSVLSLQSASLSQLVEAQRRQVSQGNLSRSELIRLQAALLELESELHDIRTEWNDQQRMLRSLLCVDTFATLYIDPDSDQPTVDPETMSVYELVEKAFLHRPDLHAARLQKDYHHRDLKYEKSLRVPDVTLGATYDRWGGVWRDFVGFGVSIDLPLYNRNQGAVRSARFQLEQSGYLLRQQENEVRQEVAAVYDNYCLAYAFYRNISSIGLDTELEEMYAVYVRNLAQRHISMMEFIDFMEAYRSNRETLLAARRNLKIQWETLQHTIGQ